MRCRQYLWSTPASQIAPEQAEKTVLLQCGGYLYLPFVALLDINNLTQHTLPVFKSIGKTIRDNKMAYHELKSLTRVVTYFSCFL